MSSQDSARSFIRTLGVSMSSQDSARSYIRTFWGIDVNPG